MTTPIFTTSHPGFMASTEDCNLEFIQQNEGPRNLAEKVKNVRVYIDGDLEDDLGYDIPIWLSGDVTGETQKCYVWNVDATKKYEAELTWEMGDTHWDSHGYIRYPAQEKKDEEV